MKVVIIPALRGSVFYRIHQPYGYLKNVLDKDIFIYDRNSQDSKRLKSEILLADIIIYQKPITESRYRAIKTIMSMTDKKRKVVADFDDYWLNVHPWNPAYGWLGTKDVNILYADKEQVKALMAVVPESEKPLIQINPDGSATVTMWKNKTPGFDIEENLARLRAIQCIIGEVDLLTVTTQQLSNKFRKYRPHGKMAVLPNLIDFNRFQPMEKKNDGKIRIVWQGGATHYQDLQIVRLELLSFAVKHPEVEYIFKGVKHLGLFHEIKERVQWLPWDSDIFEYYKNLGELSADIAICPLIDDEFNGGKSPIKWEEMSAMKVPCVCSPTVYSNFVEHGKTGFIAKQGQWEACLEELLDPEKREQIGQNAYKEVKSKFSIDKATLYWSALEDLMSENDSSRSS